MTASDGAAVPYKSSSSAAAVSIYRVMSSPSISASESSAFASSMASSRASTSAALSSPIVSASGSASIIACTVAAASSCFTAESSCWFSCSCSGLPFAGSAGSPTVGGVCSVCSVPSASAAAGRSVRHRASAMAKLKIRFFIDVLLWFFPARIGSPRAESIP